MGGNFVGGEKGREGEGCLSFKKMRNKERRRREEEEE